MAGQRKKEPPAVRPLKNSEIVSPPYSYLFTERDEAEDDLLTMLMSAGEALAAERLTGRHRFAAGPPQIARAEENSPADGPDDLSGLVHVVDGIRSLLARDARLAAQVERLPDLIGDGELLCLLFRNLYPSRTGHALDGNHAKGLLSKREIDVLRRAVAGHAHAEIGRELDISARTVGTHLENIYRKLGVKGPMQAVARGVALGAIDFDPMWAYLSAARYAGRGMRPFRAFCADVGCVGPRFTREEVDPLAAFGLLLLVVSACHARQLHGDDRTDFARGAICELDSRGEPLRAFGAEYIETARSIAVIPAHAHRRGFTPGNVLVAHDLHPQHGLNRGAISEFAPDGEYVRTFCGGADIRTRLIGSLSISFGSDGRLFATSGWLTEAILAFEEGGASVRRFAPGGYNQIAVGPDGSVYAAQSNPPGGIINVFDGSGRLRGGIGEQPGDRPGYHGVAVDSRGHVFAAREDTRTRRVIDEYDSDWSLRRSLDVSGFFPGQLTIDSRNCVYVPCERTGDVKVLSTDGTLEERIDLSGLMVPLAVTAGEDGSIWVCGSAP